MKQNRFRTHKLIMVASITALLMMPASLASAAEPVGQAPVPLPGSRDPLAIEHTSVVNNDRAYNELVVNTPQAKESVNSDGGKGPEAPGRGIKQTITGISQGTTLYAQPSVCNDFNNSKRWASSPDTVNTDIFTNWYGGWAPFAVNEGLYQAKNTVFSAERVVGPGKNYGASQYSAKISSTQPYQGGFGSPLISVTPGAKVTVSVKYLLFDHDLGSNDYDWASMGIKPDAGGTVAEYVNGYKRGEWAEMTHTITAGSSGQIMVLLQGSSPASLNSNIYFDDVMIQVDSGYVASCLLGN